MKPPRWHACNVLKVGADAHRLWQFAADNGDVSLSAERSGLPTDALPENLIVKNWRSLWHHKLNVAWLPAEQVFLRVLALPASDPAELQAMTELQLEKLSPLPVAQIIWSMEILAHPDATLRSVIVIIVARTAVEAFLGQLEGDGYLADRLELPFLNQMLSNGAREDGGWIYLSAGTFKVLCLVAWWYDNGLKELNLIHLPNGEKGVAALTTQLTEIAWAGEIEGWLTTPPRWRLVADAATAALWQPGLSQWAGEEVPVTEPLAEEQLAALTAQRASRGENKVNLLPAETSTRYRQQFIDRLWMRGLGAVAVIYMLGVFIYFGALQVLRFNAQKVQRSVAALAPEYTNTLQLKAQLQILQDQSSLRFAALDCWKAASELLPSELALTGLSFTRGRTLILVGTAPEDQALKVTDYSDALRKYTINGTPLFSESKAPRSDIRPGVAGPRTVYWSFSCELKRPEVE